MKIFHILPFQANWSYRQRKRGVCTENAAVLLPPPPPPPPNPHPGARCIRLILIWAVVAQYSNTCVLRSELVINVFVYWKYLLFFV